MPTVIQGFGAPLLQRYKDILFATTLQINKQIF